MSVRPFGSMGRGWARGCQVVSTQMILTALTLDDVTKEVRQRRWRREEVPGRSPGHARVEGEGKEEALTKETEEQQTAG